MSAFPGPANPIFYSQFRIRGGWKSIAIFSGGYAAIIGGLLWFSASSATVSSYSDVLMGWLDGLLGLQVFLLLLFGSSRISSTVRADVTGKIIESHRLMPLSAFSAVIGYVTGPPIQAIALALVNFILGLFAASGAGIEVQRWIVANAMLAAFVLLIWVVTAQLAFSIRGGFLLLVIVIALALFTSGATMILLPALSVLTCPLIGRSVFNLKATFADVTFPFAAALVSQFTLGAICFAAAMRKYRLPEAEGFTPRLGLLLLAAWTAISLVGLRFIDEFVSDFYGRGFHDLEMTQFVASIVVGMVLAIVPISSSARTNFKSRRDRVPDSKHPRLIPTAIVVLAATAVICLFPIGHPAMPKSFVVPVIVRTSVIVLTSIAAIAFLFRWGYLVTSKAGSIVVIWLVLTWIVPLAGDAIYRAMTAPRETSSGIISTLSPIGALIVCWHDPRFPVWPGIAFQCGMVLLPAVLYWVASRRNARKIRANALAPATGEPGVQFRPDQLAPEASP